VAFIFNSINNEIQNGDFCDAICDIFRQFQGFEHIKSTLFTYLLHAVGNFAECLLFSLSQNKLRVAVTVAITELHSSTTSCSQRNHEALVGKDGFHRFQLATVAR